MSWIENRHRNSEQKADYLQGEEYGKIIACKKAVWERFQEIEKTLCILDNLTVKTVDVPYLYLTDETRCTDYYTDTYFLADATRIKGKVYQAASLSTKFCSKYGLFINPNAVLRLGGRNVNDKTLSKIVEDLIEDGKYYILNRYEIRIDSNKIHLPINKRQNLHVWEAKEFENLNLKENRSISLPIIALHDNGEVVEYYYINPDNNAVPEYIVDLDETKFLNLTPQV